MYSAVQDALSLKFIFEKLLILGSYKGRGKKRNLHLADFTNFFFFFTRLNDIGKKTAPNDNSKKQRKKTPYYPFIYLL